MMRSQDQDPMLAWRHIASTRRERTCPFDVMDWMISDFLNDHDGRRYMSLSGGLTPCEGRMIYFLTPAELDCPSRLAFEVGDLTWTEYWESRPHIVRWSNSFLDKSHVSTQYAQARDAIQASADIITDWDTSAPFDYKREVLEFRINQDILGKCDPSASEQNYRDFMTVYERRMGKRAA
jgi:hypothetical protein